MVAAPNRSAAIDSSQQVAHLIRRDRPRYRRHRPVGYKGDGRGQIQPDIPARAPVLQERTQRGGQELSCLQMQSWRLTLHKPHHILGTQPRQCGRSVGKAILGEHANKPHIVDDRHLRQCPFLAQVSLKCLGAPLSRAQSSPADLLGRGRALITQTIEELSQRSGVTFTNPLPSCAISQELGGVPR
jgi:hypothetical protein